MLKIIKQSLVAVFSIVILFNIPLCTYASELYELEGIREKTNFGGMTWLNMTVVMVGNTVTASFRSEKENSAAYLFKAYMDTNEVGTQSLKDLLKNELLRDVAINANTSSFKQDTPNLLNYQRVGNYVDYVSCYVGALAKGKSGVFIAQYKNHKTSQINCNTWLSTVTTQASDFAKNNSTDAAKDWIPVSTYKLKDMTWFQSHYIQMNGPISTAWLKSVPKDTRDNRQNFLSKIYIPTADLENKSLLENLKSIMNSTGYFVKNAAIQDTPDLATIESYTAGSHSSCLIAICQKGAAGTYCMIVNSQQETKGDCDNLLNISKAAVDLAAKNTSKQALELWMPGSSANYSKKQETPPYPTDFSNVAISLKTTACYGSCPVYEVTIHGNGQVDYVGISNVSSLGKKSFSITVDKVKSLIDMIYAAKFFSLYDNYALPVTDLPSTITGVKINNSEKVIRCYGTCPASVDNLDHEIMKAIGGQL